MNTPLRVIAIYSNYFRIHCVERRPYPEFFWSVYSLIRTKYGQIRSIPTYSVRIRENTDQKISKYGHFSRSDMCSTNCPDVFCQITALTIFEEFRGRDTSPRPILATYKFTKKDPVTGIFQAV